MTTFGNTFNQFAPGNFQSEMFGQQVSPISQLPNQIYGGILDEEPRIPFFGALQRADLPSNQRAFYQGRFSDIFQQYPLKHGNITLNVKQGKIISWAITEVGRIDKTNY
jgi:hypothetical protein